MQNFQDDRLGYVRARSLFTQDDFYDNFIYDVNRARVCVEILSPYVTNRHARVLQALVERVKIGAVVVIYTIPGEERDVRMREVAEQFLKRCTERGITVVRLPKMHQKIAIIDNLICWEGSLNILSHRDTRESMRRLEGRLIVAELRMVHALIHPWAYKSQSA